MRQGSEWEVRLLKILCIAGFVINANVILLLILNPPSKDIFLANILGQGAPIVLQAFLAFIFFSVTQKRYLIILPFFIVGFHLLINLQFLGVELQSYYQTDEEQLGIGRWMDVVFRQFPLLAVVSLGFTRLWAVLLWIFLSAIPSLRNIIQALNNDLVYFENDWRVIIGDGFAINGWMFEENIRLQLFFVVLLLAIFYFNRKLLQSALQSQKANEALGRYFSPDIKDEIEKNDLDLINQNPKDLDVAVMFTDIISFTKLSEKMDPKDVLKLLTDYQTIMVSCIFEKKGSVDKFIGDAVMANFGTPRSQGNDAQNAFDCAIMMNEKLKEWNVNREKNGLQKVRHRIGIHYGPCVVGNMGSEQRVEYAIIGDSVNVASRICDSCKNFDTDFIVSQDLYERIESTQSSKVEKNYEIRGRNKPINLVKIYS
tara:strand:- start:12 stop:1292 length:1281 start_codon:yes stop_codon:yes gene_type:complete